MAKMEANFLKILNDTAVVGDTFNNPLKNTFGPTIKVLVKF